MNRRHTIAVCPVISFLPRYDLCQACFTGVGRQGTGPFMDEANGR